MNDEKNSTTDLSNFDSMVCVFFGLIGAFLGGFGSYQAYWSFLYEISSVSEIGAFVVLFLFYLQWVAVGVGALIGAICPVSVFYLWKRLQRPK